VTPRDWLDWVIVKSDNWVSDSDMWLVNHLLVYHKKNLNPRSTINAVCVFFKLSFVNLPQSDRVTINKLANYSS